MTKTTRKRTGQRRLAPTRGSAARLLRHAAKLLDEDAACLRRSHTAGGRWPLNDDNDMQAWMDWKDMRNTARGLRSLAKQNDKAEPTGDAPPMTPESTTELTGASPVGSSDLVRRLRDALTYCEAMDLCEEAATEIERLQRRADALDERLTTYARDNATICYECGCAVPPNK